MLIPRKSPYKFVDRHAIWLLLYMFAAYNNIVSIFKIFL